MESPIEVQNYFNSSFRDEEKEQSEITAQGICFLENKGRVKPLVALKVGPQEEVFQFLVDFRAQKSCIMIKPQECEVSN